MNGTSMPKCMKGYFIRGYLQPWPPDWRWSGHL